MTEKEYSGCMGACLYVKNYKHTTESMDFLSQTKSNWYGIL